jgi:hypothetical protein
MSDDVLWGILTVLSIEPNSAQEKASAPEIGGTLRLELRNVRFTWNCPLYQESQTREVKIEVLSFPRGAGKISPERVATGTHTFTEIDAISASRFRSRPPGPGASSCLARVSSQRRNQDAGSYVASLSKLPSAHTLASRDGHDFPNDTREGCTQTIASYTLRGVTGWRPNRAGT